MKNDWELLILDENKDKWRKVKHTNLSVNRRWGLEPSKVTCSIKNMAGYNFDWIKDSTEAKLYKNGKFFLYLHLTRITPIRTTKTSSVDIAFEDYWFFRLKKQLTPNELYGDLRGINQALLMKMALGSLVIIQDRFDSTRNGISVRVDNESVDEEQIIQTDITITTKDITVQDGTKYMIGELVAISHGRENVEERSITNIAGNVISVDVGTWKEHKSGDIFARKVTGNVIVAGKETTGSERPDGYLELTRGYDAEYNQRGFVQSRQWRSDEPSWQGCGDINSIKLYKDDNLPTGTILHYFFSRDGGETWYNMTTWTSSFHTLTGSEVVKNKPKWKIMFQRQTQVSALIIDENFTSNVNWTQTGSRIRILGGEVDAYDIVGGSNNHNIRYNTDLSIGNDLVEEDFVMDFDLKIKSYADLLAGEVRAPIVLQLVSEQKQFGETLTKPYNRIAVLFRDSRLNDPQGLEVTFRSYWKFDTVTGRESYITSNSKTKKLGDYRGTYIYCRLTRQGGTGNILRLYLYEDSARTLQLPESPININSTKGGNSPKLKWLYISNHNSGYAAYSSAGGFNIDNLKLWKHKITGSQSYTPRVDSIRVDCKVETESGVEEGTIDTYTAPTGVSNALDIKFSRESRLSMLQQILSASPTEASSANPSPVWDCWIETLEDKTAKLYYKEFNNIDKGYIITRKGELEGDNYIKTIKKEIDYTSKLNAIYLVGGGWSAGIPTVLLHTNVATSDVQNKIAVQYAGKIISRRISREPYLEAVGFTLLELLKNGKNSYEITPYPEWRDSFSVGDFVTVKDLETLTDEKLRIREEKWRVTSSNETLSVVLESGAARLEKYLSAFIMNQRANSTITQGSLTAPPVAYNDNYDVAHPPELWFYIPEKKKVSKLSLFLKNQRFRAYSKSAKGESAHTHGQIAHTHGQIAHSHVVEGVLVDGTVIAIGASSEDRAEQGTSHIISVRSGNQQLTSVDVWSTVSTWTAGQAYDVEDLLHSITYTTDGLSTANAYDISWRIRHVRGGDSWYYPSSVGNMTKIANYKRGAETEMLQPRAIQNGDQLILQRFATGTALLNKYIYWSWQIAAYDSRHSHAIAGENVDATVITIGETTEDGGDDTTASGGDDTTEGGSSHSHDIDFGVYEYPYYAPKIGMFVNGRLNPSSLFGRRGSESEGFETIGMDITPDFDTDGDGIVDAGWHVIRFIPNVAGATNNTEGLGRMMVYLGFEEMVI